MVQQVRLSTALLAHGGDHLQRPLPLRENLVVNPEADAVSQGLRVGVHQVAREVKAVDHRLQAVVLGARDLNRQQAHQPGNPLVARNVSRRFRDPCQVAHAAAITLQPQLGEILPPVVPQTVSDTPHLPL